MPIRRFVACLLAVASLVPAIAGAQAAWPTKPIRMIVPYAPGGASDILGRVIAQKLSDSLGQQVVIENKPGAGGTIGTDLVAKAAADGYTLVLADVAVHTISPALYPKLPYKAADLTPVIVVATFPHVLIAPATTPFASIKDVIAKEKSSPGKLTAASSGNGTSTHLTIELLNKTAGTALSHVPYKGGGAAIADVIAGRVDVMFIGTPPAMPQIRAGKLKALAVTTAARSPAMPDVPTVIEAGLPGFESLAAQGVFAPAGTPAEIVNRLNNEIARIIRMPDVRERFAQLGVDPMDNTPEQFSAWSRAELDKWGKVIRDANVKPD